jgi:hypothetical protein
MVFEPISINILEQKCRKTFHGPNDWEQIFACPGEKRRQARLKIARQELPGKNRER